MRTDPDSTGRARVGSARITLINQFYTPDLSPTAHLCASLAGHRAARGDNVTMLTSRTGYVARVGSAASDGGVCVRRLWSSRFGSRTNAGRLLDWLTFYASAIIAAALLPRQDIVIVLTTPPFVAFAGLLHKLLHPGAKIVLWNMDCYPEALERTGLIRTGGWIARGMRAANRIIFRRLDHLVCLDAAMADLLLSQYMRRGGTLGHTIIPNWERSDLFASEARSSTGDASPSEAHAGRFVVLYLGNAGYGHEFQTLIEAAELLREEPVTFLFVGGGPLRGWIAAEVAKRGLQNIVLNDYVAKERTPAVMGAADLALITLEERMLGVMSPSKLHSNLAMALPVIYVGPAGSNVDEAIARFGCGVSLRPGDARGLASFIRSVSADKMALGELRRRARRAFEEAYCDDQALKRFDALFESLLRTSD